MNSSDRFDRQRRIPGWKQDALAGARVVVVGVGALGNEVAKALVMAGVGTILLCDPDRVEVSNLNRCVLFTAEDVGGFKVNVAAAALRRLNPAVDIVCRAGSHHLSVGLGELRHATVVASCLDNRFSRFQLTARCNLVSARMVDGGTHPWGGEVRPYFDVNAACYACGIPQDDWGSLDTRVSCAAEPPLVFGASAAVSTVIGGWMAAYLLRLICDLPVAPEILRLNVAFGKLERVGVKRHPDCLLHVPLAGVESCGLTRAGTAGMLRRAVAPAVPRLWHPVARAVHRDACRWGSSGWCPADTLVCPECGGPAADAGLATLAEVPDDVPLADLGVPECEILPLETQETRRYLELSPIL